MPEHFTSIQGGSEVVDCISNLKRSFVIISNIKVVCTFGFSDFFVPPTNKKYAFLFKSPYVNLVVRK